MLGAALKLGGGLIGGLLGKKGGPSQQATNSPLFMGQTSSLVNQLMNQPTMQAYSGNYSADMNPYMRSGLASLAGFGQGAGGRFVNTMNTTGGDLLGLGTGGVTDTLANLQASGGPRFSLDTGTMNAVRNSFMPGIESLIRNNNIMSTQQLNSDLGRLTSMAGNTGSLGANPLSKLGQGGAALTAANTMNNRNFAANLFNTANTAGVNAGMDAGRMNLSSANNNIDRILGGYGNLMNMGNRMLGTGYDAGANNINMLNQAGGLLQAFNQAGVDRTRQQFMDAQQLPIQDIMSRLGLVSSIGTQSNRSSAPGFAGGMQGGMAIGSGLFDLYNSIFNKDGK